MNRDLRKTGKRSETSTLKILVAMLESANELVFKCFIKVLDTLVGLVRTSITLC